MTKKAESFDVLTEPWIPVRYPDGRIKELGIYDVFSEAHEAEEITDENMMIEYGLYRTLITFLLDILRPQEYDDLNDLLAQGAFDMKKIDRYIDSCRKEGVSFNLFDPVHPFLQVPYQKAFEKKKGAVGALDHTLPNGNNHTHFVHRDRQPASLSYAEAARLLPVLQLFCPMGGRGYPVGINGAPYYILIRGRNLFETLIYSLPTTNLFSERSFDDPQVIWRAAESQDTLKETFSTSSLRGMLFPARSVHLFPENGACRYAYIGPGVKFRQDPKIRTWTDPHVAYMKTEKGSFPWSPQKARGVWRNIAELIFDENKPGILHNFDEGAEAGQLAQVQLYGVQTDQASFIYGMRHNIALPARLAENESAAQTAVQLVKDAEMIACRLRTAMDVKEENVSNPIIGASLRDTYIQRYYDACEADFWDMLRNLAGADGKDLKTYRLEWMDIIIRHGRTVWEELLMSLALRTGQLFSLEESGKKFMEQMYKMKKKFTEEENGKKEKEKTGQD